MFGLPAQKQKGLLGLLGTMPMNEAAPMPLQQEAMQPPPPAMQQTMQAGMQRYTQPQQPQGPSFFGEGGLGRHLAGSLGDSLMQMNGLQPLYTPMMQERRAMEQRQQMMQQQRQQKLADDAMAREYEWQDWQKQEQWKRDNPTPRYNDTIEDFNWYKSLSPQDQAIYDQMHPITVMGPDGPYAVPRSALGQGFGGPVSNDDWDNAKPVGGGGGNAPGGFPVAGKGGYASFSRAIIGQESGGRYGVANTEGSGAMGIGQIMPDTAKALSRRIGRPYRPDLLAGNSPEARDYQNALTEAALQEAWQYGGGDPRKAAYYYFAGPDKKGWGPKTRQYGEDIMRRMGGK